MRQALVLVRRAQARLAAGAGSPAEALRAAAGEVAPSVVVAALATAAAVLPAAVLGAGAGLEILQPFAVALLGGLVTSTAAVLLLVPALLAAAGGLRPPPVVGPDIPDGEPPDATQPAAREHPTTQERGGAAMRTDRSLGVASLVLVTALGLAACRSAAGAEGGTGAQPAVVETADDGGPATLRLTEEAVRRLGVQTAEVRGGAGGPTVPYAAVVYDADGAAWAFEELEPGVYRRTELQIASIDGDDARLRAGPPPGTAVVTVAAAELVGVEAGISGGE